MATILFANNAVGTLAGGITNTSTTANLSTGEGALFPAPGAGQYFVATFTDAATELIKEIVHVTNVTGDVVTLVRGQEGTTAQSWLAGDVFAALVTAGVMQAFPQTVDGVVTGFNTRTGAVTLLSADVTGALGYTPVNKAGDTMSGKLVLPDVTASFAPLGLGTGNTLPSTLVEGDVLVLNGILFWVNGTPAALQVADAKSLQGQKYTYAIDGSSAANSYNIILSPAYAAPVEGLSVEVKISTTNTGASSLNINGGTAYPIKKHSAGTLADVAAGDLTAGHIYRFTFDGTQFQLMTTVG